jgi:predicted small lipoprotein YifL
MKKYLVFALGILILSTAAAGCGRKGALTLPKQTSATDFYYYHV